MTRELIGQLLGWIIVTVAAWFAALFIMGYGLGNMFPWQWTNEARFLHLGIQFTLILAYAYWSRPRRVED